MTAIDHHLIGRRIRIARRKRGVTQTYLAQHMGFTRPVISAMERGVRPVTLSEAVTIARLLGVTLNDLAYAEVA